MRKLLLCTAGLTCLAMSGAAQAGIVVTTSPGNAVYAGTPDFDFDTASPALLGGGAIVGPGTTAGQFAQPLGSTGLYFSVGPSTSSPGTLGFANATGINWIDFIWGSVDTYNTLEVLRGDGSLMATILGGSLPPANGNQVNQNTNPIVRITFTGQDAFDFGQLRLSSTQNAFEVDNFRVNAVPEPTTWALLILGFGAVGAAMRRRGATARNLRAKLHFA